MKLRREVLLTLTAGLVAGAVIIMPALADEPFGVITSVDVANKKISFLTKGGEKLDFDITNSTEVVNGKKEKIDLEAVVKAVSQATDAGKKGVFARVTHENKSVSRISVGIAEEKKEKEKEKETPKAKPQPK